MPSIEELLNEAESHMAAQPVNDVLEINPETREISIPDSEIILGVETDQKAERKYFHCPKIVGNNIDLSELELYVVFQNASNMEEGKDRYHVTDVKTTSDGYITFSWELSAKVTAYKGDVQFVVCAIKTDSSGVKQNVWNTTIAIGKCLIGLSSDMSASEEQSASDLYTQLISELNSTASAKLAEVTTQIQTVGNNQVSNVNNAGTTQVSNVQNKGTEVLASIPDTYTELDASVKQLNEQIKGKAPVITESTTIQSGSPTTVTDSAEMPLQDMVIYGKSKQVTTTGANLAKPKLQSGLRSGITVTKYDDGSYNFKGTCTGDIYVEVCTIDVEIGKTYYFSGGAENGSSTTFQTYIISKDYSEIVGYNLVKKSFKANKELYYLNCAIYKGTTVDFTIKPMLNLGSEELPFEPYTGGKPSPSPEYPQEIVSVGQKLSTGKNLINADEYYSQFKQSDGTYKAKAVTLNDIRISLSEFVGKEITISVKLTVGANVSSVFLMYISSEQKKINDSVVNSGLTGKSTLTITPVSNTDYFVISFGSGNDDVIFSELQLELSSVVTSYEPYTGGKPAPYRTDCGVEITGKNLFGGKAFADKIVELGGSLNETNKTVTIAASKLEKKIIYEFPDKTKQYTVMLQGYNISETQVTNVRVVYEDGSFADLPFTNKKSLFVTDKNKKPKKINGIYYTGATVFIYEQCGVFEGVLTETDFKPYEHQSIQISTPTGLPAIPVPSGTSGITYTDTDGQAWIADEIDFSRGKYIQRVWQAEFDGSEDEKWLKGDANYISNECLPVVMNSRKGFCNQYIVGNDVRGIKIGDGTKALIVFDDFSDENALSNFKAHLASNPLSVMTYLDTPIETDLTEAQIQAYKSLTTFKPTSIISNDAGAQMNVEYACDTKTWVTNKINTLIKEATTS